MTFKGAYDPETSYDVGDVVMFQGMAFVLKEPASAGTPPTRDQEWGRLDPEMWAILGMVLDAKNMIEDEEEGDE